MQDNKQIQERAFDFFYNESGDYSIRHREDTYDETVIAYVDSSEHATIACHFLNTLFEKKEAENKALAERVKELEHVLGIAKHYVKAWEVAGKDPLIGEKLQEHLILIYETIPQP